MNFFDLLNPYAYVMSIRRSLYERGILKSFRVGIPVISVGNLSMGGTGKTPLVLAIANYCVNTLGKKTAIVLRGYRRKSKGYLLVSDGKVIRESTEHSGDEAMLYAIEEQKLIVICDEDRVHGAMKAETLGAEVILLDDGFQHMRLKRDFNILIINSREGAPTVLPFGKGRETGSAMRDSDIIVMTNYTGFGALPGITKPLILTQTSITNIDLYTTDKPTKQSPEILRSERILVVSGIANPERFEKSVASFTKSAIPCRFPDHMDYDLTTVLKVVALASEEKCTMIVTTTKDAVKLLPMYNDLRSKDNSLPPLAVINSDIVFIKGEEVFFERINSVFKS